MEVAEQINISQAQVSRLEKNAFKNNAQVSFRKIRVRKKQYVRRKNRLF